MAKENNLSDFLSDIASAIREKKGTDEPINAQDFASEIASIETGDGMAEDAPIKDVNFYDYDGTRLYSYSWDEIVAMTELPPLPERSGLICQEWNYSLEDILAQSHHKADVGASYITSDGMTRMYINTLADDTEVSFQSWRATGDIVTGDWGDGTLLQNISSTGDLTHRHTYSKSGAYVISINNASMGRYWGSYSESKFIGKTLRRVELGSWVSSVRYCKGEYFLKTITLPSGTTTYITNGGIFENSVSLEAIVIPKGSNFGTVASFSNSGIKVISLPNNMNFGTKFMYQFKECKRLDRIVLPQGLTTIGENMFGNCTLLSDIAIPNSVTSIAAYAFNGCDRLTKLDFSHFSAVPYLSTYPASPFPTTTPTIVVPDELYDEWIAASGWKNYTSKIVKASEQ